MTETRQREVTRSWRVACVIYALALTVGTHWPKLSLHIDDIPAPDKILHMFAFGMLTVLLWRTRWIGTKWLLPILFAWAMLDELTQAIPGLGRTFSILDVLGGWLGIVAACLLIWAFAPLGDVLHRRRCTMVELVNDELFRKPRTWLAMSLCVVGAVLLGVPVAVAVMNINPNASLAGGLVAAAGGGGMAVLSILNTRWQMCRDTVVSQRCCQHCGRSTSSTSFNAAGEGQCEHCDGSLHAGQWLLLSPLPRRAAALPRRYSMAATAGAIGLVISLYMMLHFSAAHSPWLVSLMDRAAGPSDVAVPSDLRLVIDLSIVALALAVVVRVYRRSRARAVDRQDRRCMHCGHDVHATPAPGGIGRCGECGSAFVRADATHDYAGSA